MRYGVVLPNMLSGGDARTLAKLAREVEEAGWDGVFIWDCVHSAENDADRHPTCDPWIALAAMAMCTERVRLGPMATPVARRRPWKLARETVTLDHLSGGRLILTVALGAMDDGAFSKVGEEMDRKIRAEKLDEGLAIMTGLWSGEPFSYEGKHYHLREMTFLPPSAQSPRIPIWVIAGWPRQKSVGRALRYDGVLPSKINEDGTHAEMTPNEIRAMKEWIEERRERGAPLDIVVEGETPGENREAAASMVSPLARAGVTWWLEAVWASPETQGGLEGMRTRIVQGPPRT
jgi:alkanesulfonate monooxygenase SsuD/methylene tetrahydromethanopterin reductase-like flavin-dependent oxidoreductase (luciferase family)